MIDDVAALFGYALWAALLAWVLGCVLDLNVFEALALTALGYLTKRGARC